MPRSPAFAVPSKPATAATEGGAPAADVPAAVTPTTAAEDRQVTHCYVIAPMVGKKTKALNLYGSLVRHGIAFEAPPPSSSSAAVLNKKPRVAVDLTTFDSASETGRVVFHRDGSAMMNAGCAAKEGVPSVVLALTPEDVTSSTVKEVCRAASVLYGTYDKYGPDEGVDPARWSRYRSLILLNSSKKAPIYKKGDEALLSPLGIAFTMHATKLVKSFGISTDSLKVLVSTIIETATAAKICQGICRPIPLPIPSFEISMIPLPVEGPIDITWMNHLIVRSLLELFSGDTYPHVLLSAIRAWVKAENWPAVKELCFSSDTHLPSINLDSLELQDAPFQLKGISGDSKSKINYRIIVVGGNRPLKAALLQCLMENKRKMKVLPPSNPRSPVASVLKPFKWKHPNNSQISWTAWDLGGDDENWNSFYPCFFIPNKIFMLVFDPSPSPTPVGVGYSHQHPALAKITFWLNKINSYHSGKTALTRFVNTPIPTVLLVGIYEESSRRPESFKALYQSVTSSWSKTIDFAGCFAVDLRLGDGYTFCENYQPDGNYRHRIIGDLADALKKTFNSAESVPLSWLRLEDYLRTSVKTKVLNWSQLVNIARQCGVARNTAKRSQYEEQKELRDCFDYLSNVGSIFHFRHNFSEDGCQSPSERNEIVVLDPSWFNDVMTTLTQATLTAVGAPTHMTSMEKMRVSTIKWPHGFDSRAVLDVLSKLGMIMDIGVQCLHLPFFLLPQTPFDYLKAFSETCNSKNREVFTSGCILNFGFLPSEVFSSVLRSLCKGIGLQFFWRDGIVFFKRSSDVRNQESYLLITRGQHKVTQDTIVEVVMKTVCKEGEQANWKGNLMTTALNLFRGTVLAHKHAVSYSFPCPKCLKQYLSSVTESAPRFQCIPDGSVRSIFFPEQIMEEALKGKDSMDCAVHPGVPIAEIAPSLFSLGFPSIININAVQPESNLITRYDGEQEGRPAVTLQPKTWCSNFVLDTKAETKGVRNAQVLFTEITALSETPGHTEITTLRETPGHTNVAQFYGVALRGGTLLGLSEFLPPLSIPACLFPTTTPGPNPPESASLNQVISLHDLLKVCLQQPPNLETLNRVMPMALRQRILRDVAEGLSHLHKQDPPIVHGGIDIEHVLITSLEATGPCAKITHPTIPWDNYAAPTNDATSEAKPEKTRLLDGRNRSPEVLNGYRASPKSDVWDFGILVHNLVAPLSYVALKSVTLSSTGNTGPSKTSSIPPPTTQLSSQSTGGTTSATSTATGTTTTVSVPDSAPTAASTSRRTPPPPSGMKPWHTEVERFHVAPALSRGAFVVDTDRCDAATMPPWSLQLLSCCLVADPFARSPMSSLLRICDHFN
ncbi:hypothetical protein Pelo_9884 [Pelomyxa schiedti]|nr:hypothetical protein Pelo_9884 [Pelomyxa schiedti]